MSLITSESVNREIDDLLLSGQASTMHDAEEMYLDSHLTEIARLVSELDDQCLLGHEAIKLLKSHGSRRLEDALT